VWGEGGEARNTQISRAQRIVIFCLNRKINGNLIKSDNGVPSSWKFVESRIQNGRINCERDASEVRAKGRGEYKLAKSAKA
jgi:hypothetical protein